MNMIKWSQILVYFAVSKYDISIDIESAVLGFTH